MNTNEYIKQQKALLPHIAGFVPPIPHVLCADGFTMSVQASRYHHCTPRDNTGPYAEVECWLASAPVPEIGGMENPASCVPVDVVDTVLLSHGGIVGPNIE